MHYASPNIKDFDPNYDHNSISFSNLSLMVTLRNIFASIFIYYSGT